MADPLDTHVHLFKPSLKADPRTLLLLHGTGDNEQSFSRLGALMAPEAAVLSVRGNARENGMNRFFRRRAEGVYDMEDLARRTAELIAFIDAAVRHYGLHRTGLIGIGYSNGANILASMLFRDASVAPAAVLMHPLIPFAPPANPRLAGNRVLITAGERDPVCPPALSRSLHSSSRGLEAVYCSIPAATSWRRRRSKARAPLSLKRRRLRLEMCGRRPELHRRQQLTWPTKRRFP